MPKPQVLLGHARVVLPKAIRQPRFTLYIHEVRDGGVLFGRLKWEDRVERGERFGWVSIVEVHPERRREGTATSLVQDALRSMRRVGLRRVDVIPHPTVGVLPSKPVTLPELHKFWRRMGFEPEPGTAFTWTKKLDRP